MNAPPHPAARPRFRRLRQLLAIGLALVAAACLAVLTCDLIVTHGTSAHCFADVATVPPRRVALVLGTSPMLDAHRPNTLYRYRIEAAAALWAAGKVGFLLVSGDNRDPSYDEPSRMKADLIAAGVPPERIYRDPAGLRTLDSVLRARDVFGATDVTIVSQRFHNERALYLAHAHGLRAIAFDARGGAGATMLHEVREKLARVAAVLDVVLGSGPSSPPGDRVTIGVDPAN